MKNFLKMAKNEGSKASGAVAEKVKGGALAIPSEMFQADAKMGLEGADKDSFAIPFIAVLQGLSPQLETIDGAKPGLLINTVTNEVKAKQYVLPVGFKRVYLRWKPRKEGGGFKGEMAVAEVEALIASGKAAKNEEGTLKFDGDDLNDTRVHYVLVVGEGTLTPAVMSMSRTQVKQSKRWMSQINSIQMRDAAGNPFTPPSFSHVYEVGSQKEENDKGSWHSFDIKLAGPVSDVGAYNAAKAFHAQVNSGRVTVNHEAAANAEGGATPGGGF